MWVCLRVCVCRLVWPGHLFVQRFWSLNLFALSWVRNSIGFRFGLGYGIEYSIAVGPWGTFLSSSLASQVCFWTCANTFTAVVATDKATAVFIISYTIFKRVFTYLSRLLAFSHLLRSYLAFAFILPFQFVTVRLTCTGSGECALNWGGGNTGKELPVRLGEIKEIMLIEELIL